MASLVKKIMKSVMPEANPHGSSCPNSTITEQVTAPEKRLASSFWPSEALLLWGGSCQSWATKHLHRSKKDESKKQKT